MFASSAEHSRYVSLRWANSRSVSDSVLVSCTFRARFKLPKMERIKPTHNQKNGSKGGLALRECPIEGIDESKKLEQAVASE